MLHNSVVWGNTTAGLDDTQRIAASYSCIQDEDPDDASIYPGTGNIDDNPQFARNPDPGNDGIWGTPDDDYGDLRLQDGSPCIDSGDNTLVPADTTDLDGDGNTSEPVPFDLDGNPRMVAEVCSALEAKVNMGAYEGADVDHNKIADACEWIDCDGNEQNDRSEGFRQPRYDWDHDCDIDQVDFARWQYCLGRQEPLQSLWDEYLCVELDSNDDHMISLEDWDAFQASATGPGISYNPEPPPASSPPPDPCETPENYFTITAWRSVRTHGAAGSLGIALDPDAAPNEAVIEPRQGDVQIIEVDLAQPAYPWTDLGFVYVTGSDASQPWPMSYDFINNDQTFRLFFDATDPDNRLNDQVCYTIDLSNAIVDADLTTEILCDADCAIRMLAADADGNAIVEQADVSAIAAANGYTADASNVRLDVNVDGVINATDESIASSLLNNTVACPGGMMMMGMGGGVGLAGGADALVGTSDASLAPESLLGPSGRGFPSSLPPNAERIPGQARPVDPATAAAAGGDAKRQRLSPVGGPRNRSDVGDVTGHGRGHLR